MTATALRKTHASTDVQRQGSFYPPIRGYAPAPAVYGLPAAKADSASARGNLGFLNRRFFVSHEEAHRTWPAAPDIESLTLAASIRHRLPAPESLRLLGTWVPDMRTDYGVEWQSTEVELRLPGILADAAHEHFEVGMNSRFADGLQRLSLIAMRALLEQLHSQYSSRSISPEVLSEILWWASRQSTDNERPAIIQMMVRGLSHESPLVRDTAALTLANFDEAAAREHLPRAIEREPMPPLKDDMLNLLRSLMPDYQ